MKVMIFTSCFSEAALNVSSAIIKNLSEDVEMKDPPQLTVRPAQTSTKSSTKPKSSTKSKQDQVTGKPKAVKHKPNRDVSEDSEIKFRPSAFYPQQPVQKVPYFVQAFLCYVLQYDQPLIFDPSRLLWDSTSAMLAVGQHHPPKPRNKT